MGLPSRYKNEMKDLIDNGLAPTTLYAERAEKLRIMSYNVQVGVATSSYKDYLKGSWKHVLPYSERWQTLDRIAENVRDFDIVALQELDGGSLRTGFINQTRYLAEQASFPYWHNQTNRKLGMLTQHCNGILCRVSPRTYTPHKLPGPAGRGALVANLGSDEHDLTIIIAHLSLGRRHRQKQVEYLADLVNQVDNAILLGDMNCEPGSIEMELLIKNTDLQHPTAHLHTFPSWKPKRRIDHVLVTPSVQVERSYAPQWRDSDHLPIAVDVSLPQDMEILRSRSTQERAEPESK